MTTPHPKPLPEDVARLIKELQLDAGQGLDLSPGSELSGRAAAMLIRVHQSLDEVERTNKAYQDCLTEIGYRFLEVDGVVQESPVDFIKSLSQQLTTLTTERDEAMEELKAADEVYTKQILQLSKEKVALTHRCKGMEDLLRTCKECIRKTWPRPIREAILEQIDQSLQPTPPTTEQEKNDDKIRTL